MDAEERRAPPPTAGEEAAAVEQEKVFVALPLEHKAGRATLAWALDHLLRGAGDATVVLCYVHAPPQMIPLLGTKFHASKLKPEQVNAYRQIKLEEVKKQVDEYYSQCSRMKVKAEKLVFEKYDVVEGLVELIELHGITKLVMGAAEDRHYSKKMRSPRSKKAIAVMEKANSSCKIWFVCKGNLICTRVAGQCTSWGADSPTSSSSSLSEQVRSRSLPPQRVGSPNIHQGILEDLFKQRSASDWTGTKVDAIRTIPKSRLGSEDCSFSSWEVSSRRSIPSSYQASVSILSDEVISSYGSSPLHRDNEYEVGSEFLPSILESEDNVQHVPPYHEQGEMGLDIDLFEKLQEAFVEIENLRKKAYDESSRRHKAEEELIKCRQKAKKYEDMYFKESHRRKEVEETIGRAKQEIWQLRQELKLDKWQQGNSFVRADEETRRLKGEVDIVKRQNLVLQQRITDSDHTAKGLQGNLAAARYQLDVQQAEFKQLRRELDATIRKLEEQSSQKGDLTSEAHGPLHSEFTLLELKQATNDFSDMVKIGEGGFGRVYRGCLRSTMVAIKMLHSGTPQGQSQFKQEIVVLSRVRHPNLVTLIGACSEESCLIYEFYPNGSLEDRLMCKDNSPPLNWQDRVRIIGEIRSALIFLHSAKPHPVVHGDLKPANILLDAYLVSKLSDFGISQLLTSGTNATTLHYTTNPRGTFAYIDPEFLTTGEVTPRSDVYSFGIIILQLLTAKPPWAIAREVEDALELNDLRSVLDRSAGEWPLDQARQLALLGLRCAQLTRRNRPNLMDDVWTVVNPG